MKVHCDTTIKMLDMYPFEEIPQLIFQGYEEHLCTFSSTSTFGNENIYNHFQLAVHVLQVHIHEPATQLMIILCLVLSTPYPLPFVNWHKQLEGNPKHRGSCAQWAAVLSTRLMWSLYSKSFSYESTGQTLGIKDMLKKLEQWGINNNLVAHIGWVHLTSGFNHLYYRFTDQIVLPTSALEE
ncbi:hypothetical protein L228DRAFT_56143 [Xylona heveae TC161]|uniref:Uncharacterized protein n=1 Tax=Xylona heveae (strain CBS 132557 / TC161) TaxID=1328760 RepID=A0A164Z838_XYLHT|nr:hypothetical protein L228DRAFT_56143 [Xylona heveae TC161]KZF18803.1 hypothetical protein L228DRAFT_56143 [Xylona heveae TC161]